MSQTFNIVSYNLNGIRSAIRKGWIDWIRSNDFDIIGVQETKAQAEQVDTKELEDLGYHCYFHSAEKKGYSGVAIFSKIQPDQVIEGIGDSDIDKEGRIIRADFGDFTFLNCYFPSGTSGTTRQAVKYEFLDKVYTWVQTLKQERPKILLQGDYNIAHTENDIHNPKSNRKTSGFLPEERAWLSKWFDQGGFVDGFRHKNPDTTKYSWWSMRSKTARANNKGWRIDYQSVTENLKNQVVGADLLNDAIHSDHCPCLLRLNLNPL